MNKQHYSTVRTTSWEASVRRSQSAARKRGHRLLRTMSVAHVDDNELFFSEKAFSNGDIYTGQWLDHVAHGQGKYLWADGCMHVGEWSRGKMTGKGKFSWPSGATYEGEFRNGYMDGKGTYTGSSGVTYRGAWKMNLRHGNGLISYGNGDMYEGVWRRGLQDGSGRYQWKNGNHYIGQWRDGKMNGTGTLIWKNGNRYDGTWEAGYPIGNGTLRWADGSFYVGIWSKDPKEQSGTYYPAWNSRGATLDWNPQQVYAVDLSDCRICPAEKVSIFPSQKAPNWAGDDDELLQKMSIQNNPLNENNGRAGNGTWGSSSPGGFDKMSMDMNGSHSRQQSSLSLTPTRKQGEAISKGHKNYELMLSLQLGIRYSVARPASSTSLDLRASAFDPKEKIWTRFPPEGSKYTPPHQACEFRWKDYCPVVFRTLRKLFKVDPADYMLSICGNDALRELSSPGKSGSFFYLTNDDRYMIKTIKKPEVKVLLRMLPAYYNHVRAFENTLLIRFFGLHCVKLGPALKKVRFVIMGNLFCSDYTIHRRFDLKGSTFGRTTNKPEAEIDAMTTLKDLDLNYLFRLKKNWYQEFCRQVDRDCEFLEQERIMDYSLLVGVHFREYDSAAGTSAGNGNISKRPPRPSGANIDQFFLDRWASIRLGTNMPARIERTVRRTDEYQLIGEPTGELYEVVLFFGIIDILQDYDISKKLEHAYKSFQYDPTSISAVDPKQYSKRFRDFIFKVFVEDT